MAVAVHSRRRGSLGHTSSVATSTVRGESSPCAARRRSARSARFRSRLRRCRLDSLVARLDSSYVFAGPKRGPFDVHNFRRREWNPAVESSGIAKPARLYDLRSTFASNALATGITVYELARIMRTSVAMIEAHYGALLDTAHESLLERLDVRFGPESGMTARAETPNTATMQASRT